MIRIGTTQEIVTSTPEQVAEFQEKYKRELGHEGITAATGEDEVVGYPSNVDSEGNFVVQGEQSDLPARELKPGEIGYSDSERFKTGPQLITRKKDS